MIRTQDVLQIKKINCQSQLRENYFLRIQGFVISGERKYREEKLNPSLMSLTLFLINMEHLVFGLGCCLCSDLQSIVY